MRTFPSSPTSRVSRGGLNIASGTPISCAIWAYPLDTTGFRTYMNIESLPDRLIMGTSSGSTFRQISNSSGPTGGTLSANTLTHVAACYTGDTSRDLWVNGVNTHSSSSSTGPSTTVQNVNIGSDPGGTNPATAVLGHAAVWGCTLTNDDVLALFRGASPLIVRPQFLLSYIPMDGDNVIDLVSSQALTITNTSRNTIAAAEPRIFRP